VVCIVALAASPSGMPRIALSLAALVYLISAVTRLAFFNIASHDTGGFIGIPTTIAGLLWSSLFLAEPGAPMATVGLLVTAALMVLPLPIPRPTGWRFLAFPAWALALVVLHALA
jgi:phosphatidylserine synthase